MRAITKKTSSVGSARRLALAVSIAVAGSHAAASTTAAATPFVDVALNGDGIVAEFAIPGGLIPSEWYGDTEQPRSLPPYARTFLTTAESIVTIYNPSVCHQENSIVTVESVDPETLKRTVSQRDLPAVPTQADTIRVVHEYHCDSIDHEPVRWMDIDLFSMLPGVESIRITASADGATLMRDGVLKPEARRIEFLKDEAPPEG